MSKQLLPLYLFFIVLSGYGSDLFWVGGAGSWNDPNHWSVQSGGIPGATVPGESDLVHFDLRSGLKNGDRVDVSKSVSCKAIRFDVPENSFTLAVSSGVVIQTTSSEDYTTLNRFLSHKQISVSTDTSSNARYIPAPQTHTCSIAVITDNLCPGQCNGVANVIVNPPGSYSYFWFPSGQTTQTATGLCTGQGYIVQVTDLNNPNDVCQAGIIMTNFLPFGSFFNNINPLCNLQCTGQSTINVIGGTTPYSYLWTPTNQTTNVATGLCAGTYTILVTDANNCTYTTTTIITQPAAIAANPTQTNVLCNPTCSGVATVTPTGGTPPYTYVWAPGGQTTNSITGQCAGTYTVTITDANGCTRTQTFNITQPAQPLGVNISTTGNPVACNGNCTATATANPSGGTPAYTYLWAPGGQTTQQITALCAGTYTVTVTDANGCTRTQTVTINQPPVLTLSINTTNNPLLCFNNCNATASATVGGGTPTYSYLWNPGGQTTANATGLCAGTYTVTVTDANGCTITQTVTITQPPQLTVNITTTNNPLICFNQCIATATANPGGGTPGYTYLWNPGGQTTQSISNLCAGTYTVTVTDANGCTRTQTVTITQPPQITINITTTNNPLACNGNCNATATANVGGGSPPYSYSWNTVPVQTTQTATGLCAGTYTVTITDNLGCTRTATVTITQPTLLTTTQSSTSLQCFGDCTANLGVSAFGGTAPYTYLWQPGGQTTSSITGQCAGNYTVTVTDANGCTSTQVINVAQPTPLNIFTATTNPSCNNGCNGSASALGGGGSAPYTYLWAPGGQTTPNITGLCAGTYTVTITDANGCTASATVTITNPPPVNTNITTQNVLCNGQCNGSATSNPSGGTAPYTYNWQPGNQTGSSITGLCAGSYTLTVTDANGCTVSQIVNITQPAPLVAQITATTTSCNICNGTATANAVGGTAPFSYSWNPTGQTTQTATGLCPGQYTVTITDANGCTATAVANVLQTVQIIITTSTDTLDCNGDCDGIATAVASGGTLPYSYLWNTVPIQTTQTATGLCAGTYTVTVTDANGCFGTAVVTFTNPPALTLSTSSTNLTCNNICTGTATATAGGGTPGYTYSWNTVPVQTTQTATGLCAGSYTVTVTDANGCTITASVTITQPPPLAIAPTFTLANCNLCDGVINLNPSGGTAPYTFVWSPNISNGPVANNVCAGNYTVTITDANGCTRSFTVTLNNNNGPTLTMSSTPTTCYGDCDGTVTVSASGGTPPYTYVWNPGGQTTATATGLCQGTYTVQVTDQPGCISFNTVTISQPLPFSAPAVIVNSACSNPCNGSIDITPSGGTSPYTYLWMPGSSTTQDVTGLCAGTYTLTITDANGCDSTFNYTITAPSAVSVTVNSTNVNCNSACDGTATALPSGGVGNYSYLWMPGNFSTQNIVNLCPGVYTVTVTDGNGCSVTATVTITEPPVLTLVLTTSTPPLCNNSCDGTATVTAGGGTPAYTYLWSPGGFTTATVTALCGLNYTVTVTDANGCTASIPVNITPPSAVNTGLATFNASCNSACNGAATSTPSGGTGPYTFLWMPGNLTTSTVNGLCPGSYTLTVTDANGCTASTIFNITAPQVLQTGGLVISLPSCPNSCDAIITANPVGGTPPYSYLWLPINATTQTVNGVCGQTTYTLQVTDANGCVAQQQVPVNDPPAINATAAIGQANCGVCNGTIAIVASGGSPPYTYLWTPGNQTTASITGLCAGLYTVTVTDASGCTNTFVYGVSNTTGPSLTMSFTGTTCPGDCDGTANVVATGVSPFTYNWSPGGGTTTTITGLCADQYFVLVTDANSCITIDSVNIQDPPNILANANITNASCSGICDGSITVNPSGGNGGPYTYLWLPGNQTTATITGLCVGSYSVIITDSQGCRDTIPLNVLGNTVIAFATTTTNIQCSNACTGTAMVINLVGGTAPYTYSWTDPFGQFTPQATGLCAGTYTVTVTDANGCFTTQSVTITATPPIVVTPAVTQPSCGLCNGQITLNPTGGTAPYSFVWSNGQTTSTVTGICAGLYQVTVTDANGCSQTFNLPISNPGAPTPNVTIVNPICSNSCTGSATAAPTGGTAPYTYNWLPGGQTTSSITGLCPGTYFVQVIDANGCIVTDTVVISAPTQIQGNPVIIHTDCGACQGSITMNPSGGTAPYSYLWLPGNQVTPGISNLCAGIYTVTITDANGCTQSYTVPITNMNGPTVSMNTINLTCNSGCIGSATATVSGGTPPYTYNWSNGGTTNSITGLCSGTYTLTVIDANNCSTIVVTTITGPPAIMFSAPVVVQPLCNNDCNGSITSLPLGGTLPFTYLWSNGATTSSLTGLCSGTYTVTVTDANGCTASQTVTLNNPPAITVTNVAITSSSCNTINDGGIDITVTGGTGVLTYAWSNGATTQDLTNILSGTYSVLITDVNGCTTSTNVTVNSNVSVIADAGSDTSSCVGNAFTFDGSGSINVGTYQWYEIPSMTNLGTNPTIVVNNPSPGSYTYILIVQNGGCSDTDTVMLTVNPLPFANAGNDQTIITNGSTTIGGSPTGPNGSTYLWQPSTGLSDSLAQNPTASPTATTTYTVIVTSPDGCTSLDSVKVTVLPEIVFPNGISPNGDGSNDTWILTNIYLFPNNWVEVYNRWGELLYHGDGYDNTSVYWDGTYKGGKVPVGTYYYIINLNDPLFPDVFTGPITVYR